MGGKRGKLIIDLPFGCAVFYDLNSAIEYCNKHDIPLKKVTGTGGLISAMKIRIRYGEDYYKRIASRSFATNRELASRAGKIGGKISKRGPAKKH